MVTGPGSPTPVVTLTYLSPSQTITSTGFGPTDGSTVTGTPNGSNTLLTGFASYETLGVSPLDFDITDIGNYDVGSTLSGETFAGGSTSYSGSLDVTYTYATPEPSAWTLALVCVGCFAILAGVRSARS
jgi:hypothetical protein